MSKPLLVGESNPYGSPPEYDLWPLPEGASGHRLRVILGLTEEQYLEKFDRLNLVRGEWNAFAAQVAAAQIRHEKIIVLGVKVARAFELSHRMLYLGSVQYSAGRRLFFCPHPSGLNRVWNTPSMTQLVRERLREFAPEVYE